MLKNYEAEWTEEETYFVVTQATQRAIDLLSTCSCLVVTGCPGSGKSAIIHHIALRLQREQGYEIVPLVAEPTDLQQYYNGDDKQVFILDNTFGTITVNRHVVDKWCSYLEPIQKILSGGNVKILLGCRSQIAKDPILNCLKELVTNKCSLEEFRLSKKERVQIAGKYLDRASVDKIRDVLDTYDFLPLLCKLYAKKRYADIHKFFQYPEDVIKENITDIKSHTDKTQYCALVICVLYNDRLHETWFEMDTQYAEILQPVCEELALDFKVIRVLLLQQLDGLVNTFIKKLGGTYSIIHDRVYDVAASVCGNDLTECFIRHVDSTFIGDRFHLVSVGDDPGHSVIKVTAKYENKYFKRLLTDLELENTYSTFQNKQLKYDSFREKLVCFLIEKRPIVKRLIKKLDLDQSKKFKQKLMEEYQELLESDGYDSSNSENEMSESCSRCNFDSGNEDLQNLNDRVIRLPLLDVSAQGFDDIVEFLISLGSDVNISDDAGRTALHLAAFYGHDTTVNILLKNGAVSSIADKWDRLPLYIACEEGHTRVVATLLQISDVSQCDSCFFKTPLHVACEKNNSAIVEMLLIKGCNVNQQNCDGQSALHVVCEKGYYNIAKYLIDSDVDVNLRDEKNETPLFIACKYGHSKIVQLLIFHSANVSVNNSYGLSPLHIACRHGHLSLIKILIQENSNMIDFVDRLYGRTPLLLAIEGKQEDVAIFLVQEKCDIFHCNGRGQSALYLASKFGLASLVKILLEKMTDHYVLSFNYTSWSPLIAACEGGYSSIVRMLIARNLSINTYCDGNYPLHVACEHGFSGIVKMLLESDCNVNCLDGDGLSALYIACENGYCNIVSLLLDKKADPKYVDENGWSPFHIACFSGYTDIVELFLQNNVQTLNLDTKKRSPLHLACKAGHDRVVDLLLRNGADVNGTDNRKWSPLHTASKEGHLKVVKLLLKYGADASLQNMGAKMASDLARSSFHKDVVTLLESVTHDKD